VTRSVSARLAAGLAPLRARVAPCSLQAPEADRRDVVEPARRDANRGAHVAPELAEVRDLVAFAEHLEATAALARKLAGSLETRLASSAQTSPYALVTTTNETTRADHASERSARSSELLDAHELAATLKVDVRTARRLARSGAIPSALRIGSALRWRRADIDAWLANGGQR
jgi:excisionase family DNA binding protein